MKKMNIVFLFVVMILASPFARAGQDASAKDIDGDCNKQGASGPRGTEAKPSSPAPTSPADTPDTTQ
jgi:hypothetical protein